MRIITVINAKGGCGKSTIAMNVAAGFANRGHEVLFIDMDPQAQVTQWLGAGDGLGTEGTLAAAMLGQQSFDSVVQPTPFEHLAFVASSEGLEELGRQITDREDYATILTRLLATATRRFEFVVIDSPNQISPIMENAIFPSDLFVVPFESTKAVRTYANFFKLLMRLRPGEEHRLLHVLSNLSRQPGLRQRVIETMEGYGVPVARTEVRTRAKNPFAPSTVGSQSSRPSVKGVLPRRKSADTPKAVASFKSLYPSGTPYPYRRFRPLVR